MTFTPLSRPIEPFTPLDAHLPAITIRQAAVDAIHDELRKDTYSALEIGGPLICSAADQRTITRALGPGPTTRRRRDHLIFDWLEDLVEPARPDIPAGMWHSHPDGADRRLSGDDIACFRRLRRGMHRPLADFLAILALPTPGGKHDLRAWLVGPHNTKRARLDVTPDPRPMRSTRQRRGGHARMLVATKSFTAQDSVVGAVHIVRGEQVMADHELVRAYPQYFAATA